MAASAKKASARVLATGLLVVMLLPIIVASIFWLKPNGDPIGRAAAEIARNCAGGQYIDNRASIEAGLSRYLTKASGETKVSSSDVGTVTSKLKPDGVGLEFYKIYTQCLKDGAENYLRLKGITVMSDRQHGQEEQHPVPPAAEKVSETARYRRIPVRAAGPLAGQSTNSQKPSINPPATVLSPQTSIIVENSPGAVTGNNNDVTVFQEVR